MSCFYVTNSTTSFTSPYDGFIGIAPQMNSTDILENTHSDIILNLLDKGMIDYPIVSIYTRNEYGNSSIVKFGGWDHHALKEGTNLTMYQMGSNSLDGDLAL